MPRPTVAVRELRRGPVYDGRPGWGWRLSPYGDPGGDADEETPVFIPVVSATGTPTCVLDVAGLTEGRSRCARSRSYPRNVGLDFLPLAAARPFLADQESLFPPPSISFRPLGVRVDRLRSVDRHRGRDGRGPRKQRNETMATIGTFTSTGNGFTGTIKTLNLNVKAKLVRVENSSDKGPHFRIFAAANVELGAAWQKTSNEGRDYLSVKLDDPSFPAPIYATLVEVEGEEGLQLIWSRPNRD